jgi:hypothetical protein
VAFKDERASICEEPEGATSGYTLSKANTDIIIKRPRTRKSASARSRDRDRKKGREGGKRSVNGREGEESGVKGRQGGESSVIEVERPVIIPQISLAQKPDPEKQLHMREGVEPNRAEFLQDKIYVLQGTGPESPVCPQQGRMDNIEEKEQDSRDVNAQREDGETENVLGHEMVANTEDDEAAACVQAFTREERALQGDPERERGYNDTPQKKRGYNDTPQNGSEGRGNFTRQNTEDRGERREEEHCSRKNSEERNGLNTSENATWRRVLDERNAVEAPDDGEFTRNGIDERNGLKLSDDGEYTRNRLGSATDNDASRKSLEERNGVEISGENDADVTASHREEDPCSVENMQTIVIGMSKELPKLEAALRDSVGYERGEDDTEDRESVMTARQEEEERREREEAERAEKERVMRERLERLNFDDDNAGDDGEAKEHAQTGKKLERLKYDNDNGDDEEVEEHTQTVMDDDDDEKEKLPAQEVPDESEQELLENSRVGNVDKEENGDDSEEKTTSESQANFSNIKDQKFGNIKDQKSHKGDSVDNTARRDSIIDIVYEPAAEDDDVQDKTDITISGTRRMSTEMHTDSRSVVLAKLRRRMLQEHDGDTLSLRLSPSEQKLSAEERHRRISGGSNSGGDESEVSSYHGDASQERRRSSLQVPLEAQSLQLCDKWVTQEDLSRQSPRNSPCDGDTRTSPRNNTGTSPRDDSSSSVQAATPDIEAVEKAQLTSPRINSPRITTTDTDSTLESRVVFIPHEMQEEEEKHMSYIEELSRVYNEDFASPRENEGKRNKKQLHALAEEDESEEVEVVEEIVPEKENTDEEEDERKTGGEPIKTQKPHDAEKTLFDEDDEIQKDEKENETRDDAAEFRKDGPAGDCLAVDDDGNSKLEDKINCADSFTKEVHFTKEEGVPEENGVQSPESPLKEEDRMNKSTSPESPRMNESTEVLKDESYEVAKDQSNTSVESYSSKRSSGDEGGKGDDGAAGWRLDRSLDRSSSDAEDRGGRRSDDTPVESPLPVTPEEMAVRQAALRAGQTTPLPAKLDVKEEELEALRQEVERDVARPHQENPAHSLHHLTVPFSQSTPDAAGDLYVIQESENEMSDLDRSRDSKMEEENLKEEKHSQSNTDQMQAKPAGPLIDVTSDGMTFALEKSDDVNSTSNNTAQSVSKLTADKTPPSIMVTLPEVTENDENVKENWDDKTSLELKHGETDADSAYDAKLSGTDGDDDGESLCEAVVDHVEREKGAYGIPAEVLL